MSDTPEAEAALRAQILADPALVLDDRAVMGALIEASDAGAARNVVDLRGALVSRLEARLDQLEQAHRTVIAAAYENLSGVAQIHRIVLELLDARDFPALAEALLVEAPRTAAVEQARLCLETEADPPVEAVGLPEPLAARIVAFPEQGVEGYAALADAPGREGVWLRRTPREAELLWGDDAPEIGSEALIALDLGERRGMLAFGAADPERFAPDHGSDLVGFLGGVAARRLRALLG